MATDIAVLRLPTPAASASPEPGFTERQIADLRQRLERAVSRVCPAWLANDREDLVQIALTKLMENAVRDRTALEFSQTYLRRVAYSHVVDEIRRRRRRRESSLDASEETVSTLASVRPDPEALSAGSELGTAIRESLAKLAPTRRSAVTLWLLGHTHRDIARRMGWNRKRAENLVTRGRQNLRDDLTARGFSV